MLHHMRQVQLHLSEYRGIGVFSNNCVDYHIIESNTHAHTHTSIGTANFKHSVGLYCQTTTQVHHGKVSWNLQIPEKQYVGF